MFVDAASSLSSERSNNPFGIKVGSATQHWIDEGKAVLGSKASDGGQFLIFKDEATANVAHDELLYNNPAYSGLTVDAAMKKWSGYGPATTDTTLNPDGTPASTDSSSTKTYEQTIWDKYNITPLHILQLFDPPFYLIFRHFYLLDAYIPVKNLLLFSFF